MRKFTPAAKAVGAGLSLERFAKAKKPKWDKREKLQEQHELQMRQRGKYNKLKRRLEAQGQLAAGSMEVRDNVEEVERDLVPEELRAPGREPPRKRGKKHARQQEQQLDGKEPEAEERRPEGDPSDTHGQPSSSKSSRPVDASAALPAFIPSKAFSGAKPGYVFRKGPQGLGYYVNRYAARGGKGPKDTRKGQPASSGKPVQGTNGTTVPAAAAGSKAQGLKGRGQLPQVGGQGRGGVAGDGGDAAAPSTSAQAQRSHGQAEQQGQGRRAHSLGDRLKGQNGASGAAGSVPEVEAGAPTLNAAASPSGGRGEAEGGAGKGGKGRGGGKGEQRQQAGRDGSGRPLTQLERLASKVQGQKELERREREEARRRHAEKQAKFEAAKRSRQQDRHKFLMRTPTGQPLLKFRVDKILSALEKGK